MLAATVSLQAGRLGGTGTVTGSVSSAGLVEPVAPGLTISGGLTRLSRKQEGFLFTVLSTYTFRSVAFLDSGLFLVGPDPAETFVALAS